MLKIERSLLLNSKLIYFKINIMATFKKHLAVFESASDYEAFKSSEEFVTPNVSLCRNEHKLHYNAKVEETNDPFNGHAYVDLGLPSGTLWASAPLTSSEGEALYFQWGDTEGWTAEQVQNGEKSFAWYCSDYKWSEGEFQIDGSSFTKYNAADGKVVLDLEDDAAHVHMGGDWHMPMKEQLEELTANTTSTWTTINGVNGMLLTSKANGNSVFVPAFGNVSDGGVYNVGSSGYVCSSSVNEEYLYNAWSLNFYSSYLDVSNSTRSSGQVVFGVVG